MSSADEADDVVDCGIGSRLAFQRCEALRERPRTKEQPLIEISDDVKPLPGEMPPSHADDVKSFEDRTLADDSAIGNHVTTNPADPANHRLLADPRELVHGRQSADVDVIAHLAVPGKGR